MSKFSLRMFDLCVIREHQHTALEQNKLFDSYGFTYFFLFCFARTGRACELACQREILYIELCLCTAVHSFDHV